jgi:nicotinate-nucleotide adenylyltransferase
MAAKKRIGLYGGTFDPPHNAHLSLAQWVLNKLSLDFIYFIPTAIHAFKNRMMLTPQEIRFNMLKAAIADHPGFKISRIEFDRSKISYTIDTLLDFCRYEKIARAKLFYIIGMDNLMDFHLWKDPDKILNVAQVVVMKRTGFDVSPKIAQYLDRVVRLESPIIDISATQIRKLAANALPFKHLVPDAVYNIIRDQHLYHAT